jgi:hypothetical protein
LGFTDFYNVFVCKIQPRFKLLPLHTEKHACRTAPGVILLIEGVKN